MPYVNASFAIPGSKPVNDAELELLSAITVLDAQHVLRANKQRLRVHLWIIDRISCTRVVKGRSQHNAVR